MRIFKFCSIFLVSCFIANSSSGQNNTFPTPSGNVGIGTSSPSQKLHVVGKTLLNGNTILQGSSRLHFYAEADGPYLSESYGIRAYPFYSSHAFMILNQPLYVGYEADGTSIDTYDGSMMLSNRLGVGTTTPSRKVAIHSLNNTTLVDIGLFQGTNERAILGVAGASNDFFSGSAAGDMAIRATSGRLFLGANSSATAPALTMLQNGNVGLGTIAPGAKFHTNGSLRFEGVTNNNTFDNILVTDASGNVFTRSASTLGSGGGSSNGWGFGGNAVTTLRTLGTTDNFDLPIITNNIERARFSSTGSLGIGTAAPYSTLHVNGSYTQTSPSATGTFLISQPDNNRVVFTHSAFGTILNAGPDNVVRFDGQQINAAQRGAYLSNNTGGYALQTVSGNVTLNTADGVTLIGTTVSPSSEAKLAVNGNIWTKKIRVTTSGWADYVFEDEYQLRPLKDLGVFVKKFHHLPEVPSAGEVQSGGVDLGDNQVLLLKKIEELTLYLLQQDQRLDQQSQEISELKQELIKRKN